MKYTVACAARAQICVGCALISERRGFDQAYFYFIRKRHKDTFRWGKYPSKDWAWEEVLSDAEECARRGDLMFIRGKEDE